VIGFLRTALNRLTSIGKPRASDGSSWARARRQSAMPDKTNGCLLVATRSISTHVSATQDAGAQTLNWTPVAAVTLNPERDAVIQAYCDEATDNFRVIDPTNFQIVAWTWVYTKPECSNRRLGGNALRPPASISFGSDEPGIIVGRTTRPDATCVANS